MVWEKEGSDFPAIKTSIGQFQMHLGALVEAMEDALCNWQKRSKAQRDTAQTGFVAKTCPLRFVSSPCFA
jgi:hypothetical protein